MGKFKDLAGQKFGRLTVIKIGHRNKRNIIKWECLCDCGKITFVSSNQLNCGETKSCGCYHDEAAKTNRALNLIGHKYDRLIVMERLGHLEDKGPYIWWKCKCDCGQEILATTGGLRSGNPRSCGCLKIEATKAMCGPKHPNWNPDKSNEDREYEKKYRKTWSPKYKEWSKAVKERDAYTCQVCGSTGKKLESHHIQSWIEYPDLRYEINNGLCMCKTCHKKFHKKYKYKKNGQLQIEEFKRCYKEV